ncbi:hypothetical protein EVAR_15786_1 [Eumeta japonica]|uniref:Uncharacterized protein n=1 Tax=Eumeta variegata TaxID=151549 RepID=A0A4C1TZS8_EUMVA|nr:hypothetical protein EVAR_15786_1 [Eumeta japonica]
MNVKSSVLDIAVTMFISYSQLALSQRGAFKVQVLMSERKLSARVFNSMGRTHCVNEPRAMDQKNPRIETEDDQRRGKGRPETSREREYDNPR